MKVWLVIKMYKKAYWNTGGFITKNTNNYAFFR